MTLVRYITIELTSDKLPDGTHIDDLAPGEVISLGSTVDNYTIDTDEQNTTESWSEDYDDDSWDA